MGFADPKFFNALNMLKIYERCLKIRNNDAIRKNASIPAEITETPVIKDI